MANTAPLNDLIQQVGKFTPEQRAQTIIGIDPGGTTGVFAIDHTTLETLGQAQLQTKTISQAQENFTVWLHKTLEFLDPCRPTVFVVEDYRVYAHKQQQHVFSDLHTPQLIGALKWFAHDLGFPVVLQNAQTAKNFLSDKKLKDWGFHQRGKGHAMDATRHALYFAIFGNKHFNPPKTGE